MSTPQENPLRSVPDYLAIALRRRWYLILPMFLGWAAVVVSAWFIPPKYRSETVIIVEQQKVPEQYVVSNVAVDLQQRLQSMTEQILSRTRLLGIIDSFQLYRKKGQQADPDLLVKQMRKDIKIDLVQAPGRPWELSAFKISYSASTPVLAQQVTKELSSLFIEENLQTRQQLSEDTTKFLENQLEQARKNLASQEERLREFKSRYLGELPEQLQTNIQILSGLQARLQAATEALDQANQQKLYLESLLNQYKTLRSQLAARSGNPGVSRPTLDDQIERLKAELADLSARATPKHPDVLRLKRELADAETMKQQMHAEPNPGKPEEIVEISEGPRSLADLQALSPILQVEGQIKSNRLEITNRQTEVRRLEAQIDAYQSRLNMTPVREQQVAALTRDYEQSRTNYESLLNKKMQSEMATSLEKRHEGQQFRIIDAPNFPEKPYSPDRLKFSLLGLVFGIALGLGVTALVEMMDERIYSEQDVLSVTPVPVLSAIPQLQSAVEQQRQQWFLWLQIAAALLLIASMPVVTLLAYYKG